MMETTQKPDSRGYNISTEEAEAFKEEAIALALKHLKGHFIMHQNKNGSWSGLMINDVHNPLSRKWAIDFIGNSAFDWWRAFNKAQKASVNSASDLQDESIA